MATVPFAVAGLLGIFSRRINRAGAAAGILTGIAAGGFLFADSQFELGIITSPYLASFLHRIFLAAVVSAVTMIAISLAAPPPPEHVTQGAFSLFGDRESMRPSAAGWYADYRLWAAVLFVLVMALWYLFA